MYTTRTIGRAATIVAAIALAAGSVVAAAASPDPNDAKAEVQAPKPAGANKSQRICVKDTVTGSRMPRKFCKTREEWINQNGTDPLEGN